MIRPRRRQVEEQEEAEDALGEEEREEGEEEEVARQTLCQGNAETVMAKKRKRRTMGMTSLSGGGWGEEEEEEGRGTELPKAKQRALERLDHRQSILQLPDQLPWLSWGRLEEEERSKKIFNCL